MSVIIPFRDLPAFRETVPIDGVLYVLEFQYNTRADFWTMAVYSKDGAPLLTGIKVVIDYELVQRYGSRGLPFGNLYAIDVTGISNRIGRRELPDSIDLVYMTEAEVTA